MSDERDEIRERRYYLEVPLDASEIEEFTPDRPVKVAVQQSNGEVQVETVQLGDDGRGEAAFRFAEHPGRVRIIIGPEEASAEELTGLQTLTRTVSSTAWREEPRLSIEPIRISPYYWYWWRRWCRTFTIRGRVVCPDGSPVPGAEVCAFDVDKWWWWCSRQQVGCATTDADGTFTITFRWCCGWWPWWWWHRRDWYLEPVLAERIVPVLQKELDLRRLPVPTPQPDPAVFEKLLAGDQPLARQPEATIDPTALEGLRGRLLERLPQVPELAQLRIWPWSPWAPWWDCTPDIIFRVTQNCFGDEEVIVDEGCLDARWNIDQETSVVLVATEEACCIPDPCRDPQDCPEGNCVIITHACDDPVYNIGGNTGAPSSPEGYRSPGVVAAGGDRPYAGVVPIRGQFGDMANVDYYQFEWSTDGISWNAMPPAAAGGFTRVYYGTQLGTTDPPGFHGVAFPVTTIDGELVIESREHFEANNDPTSWGSSRFWISNWDRLFRWLTENNFPDDTYYLRLVGWDLVGPNDLDNRRILPLCETDDDNGIVLTIDNRVVGAGSGHPTAPDHPCGSGTVHTCTTEPDTDIIDVRLVRDGVALEPVSVCGDLTVQPGDKLQVDFLAHDPDRHLAYYRLRAHYGENAVINLLGLGGTLTPLSGASVPAAPQVGPGYGAALGQGATSPHWAGGAVRLEVDAAAAFPETCCYLLRLDAYKRTIASCNDNFPHRNRSEYSFMVTV